MKSVGVKSVGTASVMIIAGPSGVGKTTLADAVADAFDRSARLRADDFVAALVRGVVDPWRPEAARQNAALGAAIASAAAQLAEGGFTTVVDGGFFPDGARGFATICARHHVDVHYVVLRAPLSVCRARVLDREDPPDDHVFAALHDRYDDLGEYESHVIDARPPVPSLRDAIVTAVRDGRFAITHQPGPRRLLGSQHP